MQSKIISFVVKDAEICHLGEIHFLWFHKLPLSQKL